MATKCTANERGSVIVEAAITLPVFWLFLAAIIQFGYTFAVLITMQNAALSAVRSATLGQGRTAAEVCEVARAAATSMIEPTELVCSTSPQLPASPDTLVTVALSYPMPLFFQDQSSLLVPSWILETRASMY